jgi:hypothetical protein
MRIFDQAASASVAVSPVPLVDLSTGGYRPEDEEAELPPAPTDLNPAEVSIYGVVYDLATKRPVGGANIAFASRSKQGTATTDAHGWYRMNLPTDPAAPVEIVVSAYDPRYLPSALQERDPPLASNSDAMRRTIAEASETSQRRLNIRVEKNVPLAELDLALIPRVWPQGMPPAEILDAADPPIPDEPNERTCRYYGIVYDLASKKPIRRLPLVVGNAGSVLPQGILTDGYGRYLFDAPVASLDDGMTVTATVPDHRPGLVPERDPPMRLMSAKTRRGIADVSDLAFDPTELPSDCDEGLIRFDLVAVPQRWPSR